MRVCLCTCVYSFVEGPRCLFSACKVWQFKLRVGVGAAGASVFCMRNFVDMQCAKLEKNTLL